MGRRIAILAAGFSLAGCADTGADEVHFPTPIEHVVVIVKENHTFDNYFTGFPGADSATTATLSDGKTVVRPLAPDGALPCDLPHDHDAALTAYRDGKMNGFDLLQTRVSTALPLQLVHYPRQRIPNYWAYASAFVLADQFHTTTLGPSFPGYLALWAAQSPAIANVWVPHCGADCAEEALTGCNAPPGATVPVVDPETCEVRQASPCFGMPVITDEFPKSLSWVDYAPASEDLILSPLRAVRGIGDSPAKMETHLRRLDHLLADLDAGELPNLLVANVSAGPASEHPPQDPCAGENFTVEIVNRVMALPEWKHTAILITWDDWGGFYDHVAPEVKRCPDGSAFSPGFRVPLLIVSPYARPGVVLHQETEQASVPRLIEDLFGLPRLATRDRNARDARAGSLLGAFDFFQAARPPLFLRTRTCH